MDEVVNEFITESHENLDQLDQELVALEQNPDKNVLARVFRTIHTIKGTSGFLGFGTLESVTHVGENLLSKLRDGDLQVTSEITSGLLAMLDAVRVILDSVVATGGEGGLSFPDLVDRLSRLNNGEHVGTVATHNAIEAKVAIEANNVEKEAIAEPAAATVELEEEPAMSEPPTPLRAVRGGKAKTTTGISAAAVKKPRKSAGRTISVVTVTSEKSFDGVLVETESIEDHAVDVDGMFGVQLLESGKITEAQLADALQQQDQGDTRRVGEILVEQSAISSKEVTQTLKAQSEDRTAVTESIRVDVGLLDDLMNLVGELVLARNQILQFTQDQSDPSFNATSQRLNLITTELQAGVMKTRMQPIENVWNKFPRVVRDLTIGCGKQARLEMEGKHTELDKTLLEAIKDPLTHLVRNSVDHGLESPADRLAAGKPAEGVVRLAAYHEGGQVIIEISDDGAGIDAAKVRRKAVQKGMLTADEAAGRTDREILNVIFLPGFSTAESVSNISGRGVGMDVVKTNIEGIGGSVDVQTVLGKGTTFKVKIPLTLAIIPALVVTVGDGRYAIPQVSLLELVRLDGHHGENGIEWIQGVPVHRLRGRLLPLVFLNAVFDAGSSTDDREAFNIVVVQADDHQFGLVVDEISDTAEIVVKPLGRLLKHVEAFAGATIMGDGRVALILDVMGIANHVGITAGQRSTSRSNASAEELSEAMADRRRLLLFSLGERRLGLPLEAVARLEEFRPEDVEISSHRPVVQYRGEIMPLVHLSDELNIPVKRTADQPMQVVVYNENNVSVGLVVDEIFDIVEEAFQITDRTSARGIQGTAVIQGLVTDVIDVREVLNGALPGLLTRAVGAAA